MMVAFFVTHELGTPMKGLSTNTDFEVTHHHAAQRSPCGVPNPSFKNLTLN